MRAKEKDKKCKILGQDYEQPCQIHLNLIAN